MSSVFHGYLGVLLIPYFLLAWLALGASAAWPSNWRRLALTPGLGAAAIVLLTMLSAPLTHNLGLSVKIGACLAGVASLSLWRKSKGSGSWRLGFSLWHLALVLWIGGTLFLVARVAWRFDFHDQMRIQAHPAVIEAMLRGNFPPALQVFPDIPLKYHFGADLLAAVFAYVFGLPGYRAIDLLQGFGWLAAALGLYVACRQFGWNRFLSFLGVNWILLAAGWLYLLKPWLGLDAAAAAVDYNWPDNYVVFQRYLNPGVISYFFQTPYCLGLPVFFAYLALLHQWTQDRSRRLLILCSVLLGAFSLIHITLFLASLGCTLAIVFVQSCFEKISWKRRLLEVGTMTALAVGIAFYMGGFFAVSQGYGADLLAFHWPPGYLRHALDVGKNPVSAGQAALWYLSTLGSLCIWTAPAAITSLILLKKNYRSMPLFFLLFAAGSLALPQFFHYRLSWDIIKWFTAFQFGAIFLVLSVVSLLPRGKFLLYLLLALSVVLDTLPSYRMLYGLGVRGPEAYQGKQRGWAQARIPARSPWIEYMMGTLRERSWHELVLAGRSVSDALSIYTGQAMASMDYNTVAFGVRRDITRPRNTQINSLTQNFNVETLKNSPIRWIVYGCEEFERTFSENSRKNLQGSVASGELIEVPVPASLGCWKLYRLP